MISRFVEATDGSAYGKFLLLRMDEEELDTRTAMPPMERRQEHRRSQANSFRSESGPERRSHRERRVAAESMLPRLLTYGGRRRFNDHSTLVTDLQRGTAFAWPLEGGTVGMQQFAAEKFPAISGLVCPLYLPFVAWLHEDGRLATGRGDIREVPRFVELS